MFDVSCMAGLLQQVTNDMYYLLCLQSSFLLFVHMFFASVVYAYVEQTFYSLMTLCNLGHLKTIKRTPIIVVKPNTTENQSPKGKQQKSH